MLLCPQRQAANRAEGRLSSPHGAETSQPPSIACSHATRSPRLAASHNAFAGVLRLSSYQGEGIEVMGHYYYIWTYRRA